MFDLAFLVTAPPLLIPIEAVGLALMGARQPSCARLEEQGLLKRAADKSDARATLLTLTATGKRKLARRRR